LVPGATAAGDEAVGGEQTTDDGEKSESRKPVAKKAPKREAKAKAKPKAEKTTAKKPAKTASKKKGK